MNDISPFSTSLQEVLSVNLPMAKEVRIAVALMSDYGLCFIEKNIGPETKSKTKYLIGIDLPTPPSVLEQLMTKETLNPNETQVRIYTHKEDFHPKVYIITRADGTYFGIVGSANATRGGFENNIEMNFTVSGSDCLYLISWFEGLFTKAKNFDSEYLDQYKIAFHRNKILRKTIKANLDSVTWEDLVWPLKDLSKVTNQYFFGQSDFITYNPEYQSAYHNEIMRSRQSVGERFRALHNLIYPRFSEFGINDLYPHQRNANLTSTDYDQYNRGSVKDAKWLHYGKSEVERSRYEEKSREFGDHIRLQVILRNTENSAFIGVWLFVGKSNGSNNDRTYLRSRLDSSGFLGQLYEHLSQLGLSYFVDINNQLKLLSELNSEKKLKDFLTKDDLSGHYKIGRNYPPDHPDLKADKIAETVLIEFSKLYKIFELYRHRMPIIKTPVSCTSAELDEFEKLVRKGGQVNETTLRRIIDRCRFLGFYYIANDLVATSAIKVKNSEAVKKIYDSAKVESSFIPELEFGYAFTIPEHRGKGINRLLFNELLNRVNNEPIYSTTSHSGIKQMLLANGFVKIGHPFTGKYNDSIELFQRN